MICMACYVLDTHALIWYLSNDSRLGRAAREILDEETHVLVLPVIVLAEARFLADRKRVPIPFDEILRTILKTGDVLCIPSTCQLSSTFRSG